MRVVLEGLAHSFDPEVKGEDTRHFLFTELSEVLLPGNVYGLVGPSGSGKSTLLSIVASWLKPTLGKVTFEGIETTRWVFQNPHGVAGRTALDHVVLPLLAAGFERGRAEKRAFEYLEKFNLGYAAERTFKELSGGEAQRLMLARGIASRPNLLLVDEPTAQLDISTAKSVSEVLGNIAQEGTIVVVATHDEATKNACTHVVDLKEYA